MNADELTRERERARVEGKELAALVDVSPAYISMLENGKRRISDAMASRLRAALDEARELRDQRRRAMRRAVDSAFESPELKALRADKGFEI